jgi:hypothetical protein
MRRALPPKKEVLADPTLLTTLLVEGAATAAATVEEAHTADAMASDGDGLRSGRRRQTGVEGADVGGERGCTLMLISGESCVVFGVRSDAV